jgi:hypothetical protein
MSNIRGLTPAGGGGVLNLAVAVGRRHHLDAAGRAVEGPMQADQTGSLDNRSVRQG